MFKAEDNKVVNSDSSKANKTIINLSKNNKFRNLIYVLNIKATKKSAFLTFNNKKTFNHLKQAFINALILQQFDLKIIFRLKQIYQAML